VGHVTHKEQIRNSYKILVGKLEGKRPVRRPRDRYEDNIKMDFRQIRCDSIDYIHLPQDTVQLQALVNVAMNLWIL